MNNKDKMTAQEAVAKAIYEIIEGHLQEGVTYEKFLEGFRKEEEQLEAIEELSEDIITTVLEGVYEPSERGAGYSTSHEAHEGVKMIVRRFITESENAS